MSEEGIYGSDEEKSFIASDTKTLGDVELQPWTPSRAVAAQSMGLKYPHISADDREQFEKTNIYPGAVQDVAIALWLCSLTEKADVIGALRRPLQSLEKAIEWAAEKGITQTKSDEFWKAYELFLDIIVEANKSASVRKDDGGTTSPN